MTALKWAGVAVWSAVVGVVLLAAVWLIGATTYDVIRALL